MLELKCSCNFVHAQTCGGVAFCEPTFQLKFYSRQNVSDVWWSIRCERSFSWSTGYSWQGKYSQLAITHPMVNSWNKSWSRQQFNRLSLVRLDFRRKGYSLRWVDQDSDFCSDWSGYQQIRTLQLGRFDRVEAVLGIPMVVYLTTHNPWLMI